MTVVVMSICPRDTNHWRAPINDLVVLDAISIQFIRHIQLRMVTLFKRRGDILPGLGTKYALVGTQEFLNVPLWGHAHGSVVFPDEVATKVEADQTCTLELKLIFVM